MKIDTKKLVSDKQYCETTFNYFKKIQTLNPENITLFEKHINKAINNLDFANFLMLEHQHSIKEKFPAQNFYDWCIIIYYYALYHAVLALLIKIGYTSKNHLATITAITLFYYHKRNILNKEETEYIIHKISIKKEEIELLLNSKEIRERASYGVDETFQQTQAKQMQEETAELVNKIKILLQK